MHLEGSCHCKRVRFTVEAAMPVPFMRCYCSICRKTAGGGGFAINLGADARTLKVHGREHARVYHARTDNEGETGESSAERHFCGVCGSALWLWDPHYPDLLHPFASAIDTPLPKAPEFVSLMLNYKPTWVPAPKSGLHFGEYPKESLEDWHRRHGLYDG